MVHSPTPQAGIIDIKPYVAGQSAIEGAHSIKLSSNENPNGVSPMVQQAIIENAHSVNLYPSSDHFELRTAIAHRFSLEASRILIGNGSDEIFTFLCQAYAGVGDEVIVTEHGFSMYKICAKAAGAIPVTVKESNRMIDTGNIVNAITNKTRLIFIANPGNPTGSFLSLEHLSTLARNIPPHIIVVIDGAYAEFVGGDYDGGASLVQKFDNIIMTRTFSKAFGLGGLRVGWAYANHAIIDILNRVRGPFNVNKIALIAAGTALKDNAFFQQTIEDNATLRTMMVQSVRELEIECDESFANFTLLRFRDEKEALEAHHALEKGGYITRLVGGYGFPEGVRVSIGREQDMMKLLNILRAFKGFAL